MIQIFADEHLAYDSRLEEYALVGLNVTTGLNVGGTAEIVMPSDHPAYHLFIAYRTIVTIYRDGNLIFRGRALYPSDDYFRQRTITCEGELCFLRDGIMRPYLFEDTPTAVFSQLIYAYNQQVEEFKQFRFGVVTVQDDNDYIRFECRSAEDILTSVQKLLTRCGGNIIFDTASDGVRVINWYTTTGSRSEQVIEFGENLLDFTSTGANSTELATGIVPYGALIKNEGEGTEAAQEKRLTIESVNGGRDYILAEDATAVRGTIMTTVVWDDVTEPENLLRKAQAYLAEHKVIITSLELSALDLSYLDKTIDSFSVGDAVRVRSKPHGLDEEFQLTQKIENLLDPSQNRIVLGKDIHSLTRDDIGALKATSTQIQTDYEVNAKQVASELERTLISRIEQTEENIVIELSDTYAKKDAVASMERTLLAKIEAKAGDITLEVSGGLGGTASINLTVDGTTQAKTIDMSEVRKAFANDLSNVVVSGGTVTFNAGTLLVNSTNFQLDANGTVTAKNVDLSGKLTTTSGLHESRLSSGRLRFFYDGTEYGGLASTYYAADNSKRGIELRTEPDAAFISFSIYDAEDKTYKPAYIINYGMDPSGRTERHIFYGSPRFINKAWFSSNAAFANNVGVRLTDTAGADVDMLRMDANDQVLFGHGSYQTIINGSEIHFNDTTYVNANLDCAYNIYLGNRYCLRTYTADGSEGAEAVWMDSTNYLYIGGTLYPTYVRGSTLHLGRAEANTRIYGKAITVHANMSFSANTIDFANGYGIRGANTSGTLNYILSTTSSNNVMVGASGYGLRLRGSTVVLDSSGATVTSDQRRKNSIEELPDAYEHLLDRITPVRFKFNDGTSDRYHTGFVAQDVDEALKAAGLSSQDFGGFVDLNGDGEELGLIYTEFIAIQQLKIRRLEQRIAALEGAQIGG